MHINDIESLAMRLRSLTRRADMFGKSCEDILWFCEDILWEIDDIAADLEKQADRMDREMEDAYLVEQASRHDFAMDR